MAYALADLERARAELKRWQEARADDDSNNPNKHRGKINAAILTIRVIEADLRSRGVIPLTDEEKLQNELDRLHPNAKSRSIVRHNGTRYQIRYFPISISRSGKTVTEWGHKWTKLG